MEFLETWGPYLFAGIVALGNICALIYALMKIFKIGKKVDTNATNTANEIQITREGIVEAFKTAKIPTEWKISVSNQVQEILQDWGTNLTKSFEKSNLDMKTMMTYILMILNYTAASNKLTEEQKVQINDMLKAITEEEKTIDITE